MGEYAKTEPQWTQNNHFTNENTNGGAVSLPLSVAASGAVGLEFAYLWIPPKLDFMGFELYLGFRLTDMPHFWSRGSYFIQPCGGVTVLFALDTPKASLLIDGLGFSAGGMLDGGENSPISIAIVLPLGIQVQFKNLRLFLRHELEFAMGYNWLAQGRSAAYRQSEVWKYNLILGIGWGFSIADITQKRKAR